MTEENELPGDDYFDKILEGTDYLNEPEDVEVPIAPPRKPKPKPKLNGGGYPINAGMCPKCHTPAVVQEGGCLKCLSCGDSKCG